MELRNDGLPANIALMDEASKRYETVESWIAMMKSAILWCGNWFWLRFVPVVAGGVDALATMAAGFADMNADAQTTTAILGALLGLVMLW